MPRPKRSRVTATRPTKAQSPPAEERKQSSPTPPVMAKPAVTQPQFPSSDIYDVSDREKERIRQRRAAETAKADAVQARPTLTTQHLEPDSKQTKALEDSRRRRDEAMNRLDDLTSTSRPDDTESPAIELSRRDSVLEIQPRLTDASGLDLEDDFFGNLDDSLDDTENAIEETQTGYRSTDTSSFNIAMFKRRPRQSSVAGRDDAPIRPSSRGQNTPSISTTLNFGNFRRRAREPSILGTARKARTQRSRSATSQASRNASVLGDGDDSGPEGESTPINKTRRQTRASLAVSGSREGSPVLQSRKRKSLESHEDGREKRPAIESNDAGAEEIHQSIEVDPEPASSPPCGRRRTREQDRFSTPVPEDDPDMAPPLSSSSESGSPVPLPPLDTLAHRTYTRNAPPRAAKTPEARDSSTDISSPPSLTHSPNYAAPPKAIPKQKAPPPEKKITTADLTSLLPRRRHKASNRDSGGNDPFDLDASEDDPAVVDDEDELSYVDPRARRRKAQQPLSKATANAKGKAVGPRNGNGKNCALRTYGPRAEDKENEEVDEEIVVASDAEEGNEELAEAELPEEETSQMMRDRLGEELQKAAKKFKEVDKWELSFEVVTESSSPDPDAR
ncbi:hypothetical protein C8A03DRAFT_41881 [Achaetomium macrosporum]|uniref:Uncharacterized protein n=1 Tax=Achaetomium macrosporum TaxID=79813 RepID=A0AAN7CGQ5_9PEZI|nr:hypothetical protein C8A03DRAFT_41881 [Achaetomium macrosporum]